MAAIALGEAPGPIQGAGIALAVAGVGIIASGQSEGPSSRRLGPSVLFGLLTALGFGGFLVAMDAASEGGVPWALLLARLSAVGTFTVVRLVRRPPLAVTRGQLPVPALIGLLIVAADAMYALASTKGLLSVVAVLSSLCPVVTIALARVYLRERIGRLQQGGIAVALCGVAAISVP